MEIRCAQCQHVGPAAEVRPTDSGVMLICANCGHENQLDVSRPDASSGEEQSEPESVLPPAAEHRPEERDDERRTEWLEHDALGRLVPEPGPGPRCRKCANLLDDAQNFCPRCGLSVAEGNRYEEGAAPWERPPPNKEAEYEQATLLWKSVCEDPTEENLSKFAEFAREEELLEYGVRKLRQYLIEHPDSERAIEYLRELASSFQARAIVAQAQAQVRADDFAQKTSKFKQMLLWGVFVVWGAIFAAFLASVLDGCG